MRLSGNEAQARAGAETAQRVYEGFDAAVESGVAADNVALGKTLQRAESDEGLASVCDLMTEAARRQTIHYAERSAGVADVDWSCETATGLLLRRGRRAGSLRRSLDVELLAVRASGDRATATVRIGRAGRRTTLPLVREDGAWKLAPTAGPSGGRR